MRTLLRTDTDHPAVPGLVAMLDAYLSGVNGDRDSFFRPLNKLDAIRNVVVVEEDGQALACGAFREIEPGVVEIKRMFVRPEARGRGIATEVLNELERWAVEMGFSTAVLETSWSMEDAVGLYRRNGYAVIPNYGMYVGVETSVCMRKELGVQ